MNLVVPSSTSNKPTLCPCGESAVWWVVPQLGIIKVWTKNDSRRVSLVGIHNGFLQAHLSDGVLDKGLMKMLIATTPDDYYFKTLESLIVRFKPGSSRDSSYATHEEFLKLSSENS